MTGTRWGLALTLVAMLLATPAQAATADDTESYVFEPGGGVQFVLPAHYRFRTTWLSDFPIDADDSSHGLDLVGEQRFRFSPWVSFSDVVVVRGQLDFLKGQIFGDTSDVGADYLLDPRDEIDGFATVDPRHLWVEWRSPIGVFRLGQMPSHWGLGILANDGEDRDLRFGDRRYGDIVERVAFGTAPVAWFSDAAWARNLKLLMAFDVVFRDEQARLMDGDLAMQGAFALVYEERRWNVGGYAVYRNQEDDEGSTLEVTVADISGGVRIPLGSDGMELALSAEVAMTVGHTNRALPERAREGMDVLGFGALIRADLDVPDAGLFPSLEIGFASGDNDRTDDVNRSFSFDPDHRVGLILFEQVLALQSARSSDLVTDPDFVAVPPDGVPWLPTNGAVTNAVYFYPSIAYEPVDWVRLNLAVLYAIAPSDLTDAYQTALNGGYAANALGGRGGGRQLGLEIDAGVIFTVRAWHTLRFRVGAEGGFFVPGDAFDAADVSLGNIYTVRGMADVIW